MCCKGDSGDCGCLSTRPGKRRSDLLVRRFFSVEERRQSLGSYREELRRELAGVGERLNEAPQK